MQRRLCTKRDRGKITAAAAGCNYYYNLYNKVLLFIMVIIYVLFLELVS